MSVFNTDCRLCPRLSGFLDQVRAQHPDYFAKPVPAFGARHIDLLIVGLAPGMHGANRTGRPFTGDYAGVLLYETLHEFHFASKAVSAHAEDGLTLKRCRITNAVKCLPPENKPTTDEIKQCNGFLRDELLALKKGTQVLALGTIAHNAVLRALELKQGDYAFAHHALHDLDNGLRLVDSYHCSRYNTQTRRLTTDMFKDVFRTIRKRIQ